MDLTVNEKHRRRMQSLYGHLYRIHYYDGDSKCFYCGDFKYTYDHCPPLYYIEAFVAPSEAGKRKYAFWKVGSCKHCNQLLGHRYLPTVFERSCFIARRLEEKYEQRSTLWSPDEAKEMGIHFQRMIAARQEQAKELLSRIRHAQWRSIQTDSFPISDFE